MKVRTILTFAATLVMSFTMLSCDEDVTPPPMPEPTPEPIPQQISLVGTAWEGVLWERSTIDKRILRFTSDSTGTHYFYVADTSRSSVFSWTDNIKYQFDTATLQGAFYATRNPSYVVTFTYNPDEKTLTVDDFSVKYQLMEE